MAAVGVEDNWIWAAVGVKEGGCGLWDYGSSWGRGQRDFNGSWGDRIQVAVQEDMLMGF